MLELLSVAGAILMAGQLLVLAVIKFNFYNYLRLFIFSERSLTVLQLPVAFVSKFMILGVFFIIVFFVGITYVSPQDSQVNLFGWSRRQSFGI